MRMRRGEQRGRNLAPKPSEFSSESALQGPASRGSESNKVCREPPTDWTASPQPPELPPPPALGPPPGTWRYRPWSCREAGAAAMASGRLDTWGRHQKLVSVGREAAQRKPSPSSLPERDRASSTRWSARNRAGGQRGPGHRWRGLRLSSPPRPGLSNRSRGMRADNGARAGAAGGRQQPRRFLLPAGAVVPAGLRHGPAFFPVWAWPPSRARGLWSPRRGNQRLHPGSLGLADSAGECGAIADPGASWTPAFLPLINQWRPSGAPPGAASRGVRLCLPGRRGFFISLRGA